MKTPNLNLYYFPSCPFCQIVLVKVNELNLDVILTNIHEDDQAREKLYHDTGRYTVPCLYIDENPMHESRDIINWLQNNKDRLAKK